MKSQSDWHRDMALPMREALKINDLKFDNVIMKTCSKEISEYTWGKQAW